MPKFRFAILSDTHYNISSTAQDSSLWNSQLITQSKYLASCLIESINALGLDFVIHCGDLTHEGDRESLHFAGTTFQKLNCPCFVTLGDHDVCIESARKEIGELLGVVDENFCRSVCYEDLRFLFLDSAYGHLPDSSVSAQLNWRKKELYEKEGPTTAQIRWLESSLNDDSHTPTFVVLHHPIFSRPLYPDAKVRCGRPLARFPLPEKYPKYAPEIVSLLAKAPNVLAVFSGHWHIFDVFTHHRIRFVHTGSLVEYPFEYRIVEVHEDHMSFDVQQLNGPQLCENSLEASWGNSWVKGTRTERNFQIPLFRP